jgi:phytoene dehydrogenase-like protein
MSGNKYSTIVVGGGIAGLTAAAYISREGQKVLLIEKNRECGGLVNSFNRDGFHFDAGVRALEDAGIIFAMLKDLGLQIEVVKSKVSLGIEKEILHIENIDSLLKYRELLIKVFPESFFLTLVKKSANSLEPITSSLFLSSNGVIHIFFPYKLSMVS